MIQFPTQSRRRPPNPAGLGLPKELPSTLRAIKSASGGIQETNLEGRGRD
ncbi:hypothetical protein SESBI_37870 [Sesbania bispinosa]|nr:hypothetical protein SESBI_37870 [Sesbania bispinosa]